MSCQNLRVRTRSIHGFRSCNNLTYNTNTVKRSNFLGFMKENIDGHQFKKITIPIQSLVHWDLIIFGLASVPIFGHLEKG